jgi:hypothetical protein
MPHFKCLMEGAGGWYYPSNARCRVRKLPHGLTSRLIKSVMCCTAFFFVVYFYTIEADNTIFICRRPPAAHMGIGKGNKIKQRKGNKPL